MECSLKLNCADCVMSCQWVVREDMHSICSSDYKDVVGKVSYYVDVGDVCIPTTTTTLAPALASAGYSTGELIWSNVISILIDVILLAGCFFLWKRCRGRQTLAISNVIPTTDYYVRYYRDAIARQLENFADLMGMNQEDLRPILNEFNHRRQWAPPLPVFNNQNAPNIFNVSIPMDDIEADPRIIRNPAPANDLQSDAEVGINTRRKKKRRNADDSIINLANILPLRRSDRKARRQIPYNIDI